MAEVPDYSGRPRLARPPMLEAAGWLGLANAVCGVAVTAYSLIASRAEMAQLHQSFVAQGVFPTEQAAAQFTGSIVTGSFAVLAVLTALWMTLVFLLRANRNWARVILTVLCSVWLVLALLSLFWPMYGGAVSKILVAVQFLLLAAQLAAMNHRTTRAFFAHLMLARYQERRHGRL